MRIALFALAVVAAGLLAAAVLVRRHVALPPLGPAPHRPIVTTPRPPPPPVTDPACLDEPLRPEGPLEAAASRTMLAEFNTLHGTGEFGITHCPSRVEGRLAAGR